MITDRESNFLLSLKVETRFHDQRIRLGRLGINEDLHGIGVIVDLQGDGSPQNLLILLSASPMATSVATIVDSLPRTRKIPESGGSRSRINQQERQPRVGKRTMRDKNSRSASSSAEIAPLLKAASAGTWPPRPVDRG